MIPILTKLKFVHNKFSTRYIKYTLDLNCTILFVFYTRLMTLSTVRFPRPSSIFTMQGYNLPGPNEQIGPRDSVMRLAGR